MRQAIVGIAAFLALAGTVAASGAGQSPYRALRTSGYPDTALPAAFSSAKVVVAPVTSSARSNGATGAVRVNVNGPDADAGVMFVVFRTPDGAGADMLSAVPVVSGLAVKPAGKVAGQPASAVFAGSYTQTDALGQSVVEGVTYSVVQKGSVLVAGFTYAPTRVRDGGGAVALTRSGLTHLQAVSG
jgi:hypothetical protein